MIVLERDPVDVLTKRCTKCGLTKTWREFPIRHRWSDGSMRQPSSHCRECKKESDRDYRERVLGAGHQRLDAGPLREFLSRDGRDLEVMADLSGISSRTIWAVLHSARSFVDLSTADQIVTRCGGVFELIYPFESEGR